MTRHCCSTSHAARGGACAACSLQELGTLPLAFKRCVCLCLQVIPALCSHTLTHPSHRTWCTLNAWSSMWSLVGSGIVRTHPQMLLQHHSFELHSYARVPMQTHPGQSSAEASAEAQAVATGGGQAAANAVSEVRGMHAGKRIMISASACHPPQPVSARSHDGMGLRGDLLIRVLCASRHACVHALTPPCVCKRLHPHTTHTHTHTHTHSHRPKPRMDHPLPQLHRHSPTPLG